MGGRETQGGALSKGAGGERKRRREQRGEVIEYKQPPQYLWEPFRHVYLFYLFAALKRDISNLLFTQMSCFCTRVHMKTQIMDHCKANAGFM